MQVYTKIAVTKGDIIEMDGYTYQVESCIDLEYFTKGEQSGYLMQLTPVIYDGAVQ